MSKPESQDPVLARYLSDDYLRHNPSWDSEDSPWKAELVRNALVRGKLNPGTVAEVGCGAGGVLAELRRHLPASRMRGFDIAPEAVRFWEKHAIPGVEFTLGDFLEVDQETYDVVLMLDVMEHLANPFDFLLRARSRGRHFVFHIPLDLSAMSVLRETPLLYVREKVGHIHYFTRGLALALLRESGYDVIDWRYTGAAFRAPHRGLGTRLASIPRMLISLLSRDLSARLLGGETLIVLARPRLGK